MAFKRLLLFCAICSLVGVPHLSPGFAQASSNGQAATPPGDDDSRTSKGYALRACQELRIEMKDPESFTLMQVVAFTRLDKEPKKKSGFRGCIHYIAGNSFGGRLQAWGGYYVDKKGRVNVFGGEPGEPRPSNYCMYLKSRETSADVTADAVSSLSHR